MHSVCMELRAERDGIFFYFGNDVWVAITHDYTHIIDSVILSVSI